jgi:hypothetical protein
MHVLRLRTLRTLGASVGLALLLGCSGLFGEEPPDEDGVAGAETGDTGAPEEEEDEEEEVVDSGPNDTGRPERAPREGKRKKKDRDKRGGGKAKPKPKPSPKPGGRRMCFGGGGLDLRLDIDGDTVTGSLTLGDKIDVPKLSGTRSGTRVQASGNGTVNGKKQSVKVQAGKGERGPVVKVDGRDVKGAKVVDCR